MGLDVSHGCWSGAYSAFMRWRRQIAKCAGIPLPLMEGYYVPPNEEVLEWLRPREGGPLCRSHLGPALTYWLDDVQSALPLSWEPFRWNWRVGFSDPLIVLLNHSDCDGKIDSEDCAHLAERLEGLLPQLRELSDDPGHIGSWVEKTQRFIDGLRLAAAAGEAVEFH